MRCILKKKQMKWNFLMYSLWLLGLLLLAGCTSEQVEEDILNPEQPISITLWHYYNGHTKTEFDRLVTQFNETEGIEKGIVVDAKSHGDVEQLESAVFNAANEKIGAEELPDIFAAYPDNAYRIHQAAELVNIDNYLSKKELQAFREEFLEEGRFGKNNALHIMPIAKSTENLYVNKMIWDAFSKDTGAKVEQLQTWEGVLTVAEQYYKWSGGKAFVGIDSLANYLVISPMQLGEEMFNYSGEKTKLQFSETIAHKIWDSYYVPHIKGYFAKNGRFSSDDAKVGGIVAYTGSTAGAVYFPTKISIEDKEYTIESLVLPYPQFENGELYAVQQGAGMAIVKSDKQHEYAAVEFLKWFTKAEHNLDFAVSTGYLPVKNEVISEKHILDMLNTKQTQISPVLTSSIQTTIKMFEQYKLYGYKPFEGSYEWRVFLNTDLQNRIQQDLATLNDEKLSKEQKDQMTQQLLSEQHFNEWYKAFVEEAKKYMD